ncbi:MAG: HAMP domain-containing histidine kinase [Butyrivibrio sp.]|nr:HAMP domain-containing histidine kinase [Butyrivibrio sp.]
MDKKTRSIFSLKRYIIIFLLIAFVVSCSFFLFLGSMNFTKEEIQANAILTFLNVLFLSLIFCLIDGIQRKISIERPVKKILKATEELAKGNFKARVEKVRLIHGRNEFDVIAENINKMAGELSGIETLRTDFVSNVSHELKTPLSVIGNYSTMLQAKELSDEKRLEYAVAISNATSRLSELVTNILKLNKLENQQIYPDKQSYDLGEQLAECIIGFEDVWEKKNIELDTDIDDNVIINADKELLSLVWNNLLSNAFKFTDEGGTVKVSLKKQAGKVVATVSDTGCGISEETGKHIFDKFYQGDTSHATKGNGLGLALVKRVVDICGADISVKSTVGQGTTFTVTF